MSEVVITADQFDQLVFLLQVIGGGIWWVAGCLGWRLLLYSKNSKHLW